MILAFAAMARSNHGMRIEIDPAKENSLRLRAGIDKPALLMLTESRLSAIPADANAGTASIEQVDVFRRAPEGIRFELFGFAIGTPEDESNIQAPRRRAIQDVQRRPPTVRHLEVCPHEGHRRPNALTGRFDGFTNAAECWLSVDEWPQRISRTRGIRCHLNNWDGEFADHPPKYPLSADRRNWWGPQGAKEARDSGARQPSLCRACVRRFSSLVQTRQRPRESLLRESTSRSKPRDQIVERTYLRGFE